MEKKITIKKKNIVKILFTTADFPMATNSLQVVQEKTLLLASYIALKQPQKQAGSCPSSRLSGVSSSLLGTRAHPALQSDKAPHTLSRRKTVLLWLLKVEPRENKGWIHAIWSGDSQDHVPTHFWSEKENAEWLCVCLVHWSERTSWVTTVHSDKFYCFCSDQSLGKLWTHCERTIRSSC